MLPEMALCRDDCAGRPTPKTTDDRDRCRGPPTRRDGPLRTASRDLDAADARFIQLLSCLDRGATVLRAVFKPLGIILVIAVAIQVPCIPTSDRGADLTERYGAPHARGYVADVYAVNRTHIIKQLRGPCVAETAPCVRGRASLLHYVWWWSHAREQWRTYERLHALALDNVTQAPETFGMDHERWRIHQRRYVAPDYEPARSWPEDQLVELSEALEMRDWFLVDLAKRNRAGSQARRAARRGRRFRDHGDAAAVPRGLRARPRRRGGVLATGWRVRGPMRGALGRISGGVPCRARLRT